MLKGRAMSLERERDVLLSEKRTLLNAKCILEGKKEEVDEHILVEGKEFDHCVRKSQEKHAQWKALQREFDCLGDEIELEDYHFHTMKSLLREIRKRSPHNKR
jgi:hypothetical protein